MPGKKERTGPEVEAKDHLLKGKPREDRKADATRKESEAPEKRPRASEVAGEHGHREKIKGALGEPSGSRILRRRRFCGDGRPESR